MICFRPTESATARIFPLFPAYVCVYLRVAESICSLFFLFPYSGKLWGSIHSTFRIFLPPPSRPQFNQPCDARFASPRIIKPDDIFRPTTSVSPPISISLLQSNEACCTLEPTDQPCGKVHSCEKERRGEGLLLLLDYRFFLSIPIDDGYEAELMPLRRRHRRMKKKYRKRIRICGKYCFEIDSVLEVSYSNFGQGEAGNKIRRE